VMVVFNSCYFPQEKKEKGGTHSGKDNSRISSPLTSSREQKNEGRKKKKAPEEGESQNIVCRKVGEGGRKKKEKFRKKRERKWGENITQVSPCQLSPARTGGEEKKKKRKEITGKEKKGGREKVWPHDPPNYDRTRHHSQEEEKEKEKKG